MAKRHKDILKNTFEVAAAEGFAKVSKELLVKFIYGQERLSLNIFDDLQSFIPEDWKPEDFVLIDWGGAIHIVNFYALSEGTINRKNWPRYPSKNLNWN